MSFPENALMVRSGDIERGMWGLAETLIAKGDEVIQLDCLQTCTIVSDRHETVQTGMGRISGGIIGGVLLGPIGAAGGLLTGGKRKIDETIILCRLFDNRSFTAECSQLTAAKLTQIANINQAGRTKETPNTPSDPIRVEVSSTEDVIECPICAEYIKRKAKVCRFCRHDFAKERDDRINELLSDPRVAEVLLFSDLYQKYVQNMETENPYSERMSKVILGIFHELHRQNPSAGYRETVQSLQETLEFEGKTALLEMFREGFNFTRRNLKFDFFENEGIIVVYKHSWDQ